nr:MULTISPECIES: LLM class F420-dependent oxidoreductase [unclassified Frankia]
MDEGTGHVKVDAGGILNPTGAAALAQDAQARGYDGLWLGETAHDPLIGVALAAAGTDRIQVGTSIAVAFARSPMNLAMAANDLQLASGGRFLLGLGTQIKPHITRRFSMPWSRPAARMRELVLAIRAIWDCWNDGAELNFRGEFYTHTLMTPFFNPGPNPHGRPPVLLAGVGELMTKVAGEVADGFLCHPFTTERFLREVTLPALTTGRESADGTLDGFTIAGAPFVVTGHDEQALADAARGTRKQIAFYASTPAYRPVLEVHGWGSLQEQLNLLSKRGAWDEMGDLIDDDVLNAFAVVGEPDDIAPELRRRYGDVMTRVTLNTPYTSDEKLWPDIVAALQVS